MDLDGDGVLDIVNGRYSPAHVYWFRGLPDGQGYAARQLLLEAGEGSSMSTTNTGDLDGDGLADLIIGNTKGRVVWSRNEGTATKPRFVGREPLQTVDGDLKVCQKSDAVAADWDGDGVVDLLVGDECADVHWFRGRGDGSFDQGRSVFSGLSLVPGYGYRQAKERLGEHRVVPGYRLRLAVTDYNDDGRLDLLVGNCVTEQAADDGGRRTAGHVWVLLRK